MRTHMYISGEKWSHTYGIIAQFDDGDAWLASAEVKVVDVVGFMWRAIHGGE